MKTAFVFMSVIYSKRRRQGTCRSGLYIAFWLRVQYINLMQKQSARERFSLPFAYICGRLHRWHSYIQDTGGGKCRTSLVEHCARDIRINHG